VRQALIAAGLLLPLGLDTFALASALVVAGLMGMVLEVTLIRRLYGRPRSQSAPRRTLFGALCKQFFADRVPPA